MTPLQQLRGRSYTAVVAALPKQDSKNELPTVAMKRRGRPPGSKSATAISSSSAKDPNEVSSISGTIQTEASENLAGSAPLTNFNAKSTKLANKPKATKQPKATAPNASTALAATNLNPGAEKVVSGAQKSTRRQPTKRTLEATYSSCESVISDDSDSDPGTPKKPRKKVQRYQGPNGSVVRRLKRSAIPPDFEPLPTGMTEAQHAQYLLDIKASSNKIFLDLLARPEIDIQELTVRQHRVKLLTWKDYCDSHYDGDYTVNAEKMLPYFKHSVFERTSNKFITPDVRYDGVIGLRPVGWMPPDLKRGVAPTKKDEPAVQIPPSPAESQKDWTLDDADGAIARFEEAEADTEVGTGSHLATDGAGTAPEYTTVNAIAYLVQDQGRDQDQDSLDITDADELASLGEMVEEDPEIGEDEGPKRQVGGPTGVHIIASESDNAKVFDGTPDRYGRIMINVPLSLGTVNNYRKALIYLWKLQNQRTAPCPNPAPNPRSDGPLDEAINAYGVRLVYEKASTGTTRTAFCDTRDTYNGNSLVRMATYTWMRRPVHRTKGNRKYNSTERFPHIRERLCILARHHMLLRDEDIRNLNLSDIFCTMSMKNAAGSRWATGLTFCLRRDKTNKKGVLLYSTAFRHKDFRRCTVGAFAFYLLERFMLNKEELPDFSRPNGWKDVKLLVPSNVSSPPDSPDPNSDMTSEDRAGIMKEYLAAREKFTRDVRTALTGRTQQLATAAVMRACEVFSARLTLEGRHAGTKEAFKLGLPIQDIQHLGRWVMSQMMSFQASKNPIKGAYYMAHFNGTDEPYILARDLAVPPLALQRLVFPWLEDAFNGCSDDVVKKWHKTCDLEMADYDPEEIVESDLFPEAKDEIPGTQSGLEQTAHTDKKEFLKLLIRMRRVILQDAVQFMVPYSNGMDLSNHLIKGLPEIFASQLFLDYSKLLRQIMEAHRENSEIIAAGVPVDGPAMVDAINRSAQQLCVHLSAMQALHRQELAEKDRQLAEKDKQHQQALADQNAYFERILAGMQQFSRQAFPCQHLQPIPLPPHRPLPCQHEHPLSARPPHQHEHTPSPPTYPPFQQPSEVNICPISADKNGLTIRTAYEEYYSLVVPAYEKHRNQWSESQRKLFRRRRQFVHLAEQKANAEEREVESILDAERYKGMTVNAFTILLKAEVSGSSN